MKFVFKYLGFSRNPFTRLYSNKALEMCKAVKTIPQALKGCLHVQYFVEQICFSVLSQTPPGKISLVMSHHKRFTQINKLKSAEDSNVPRRLHQLVYHPECQNKPSIISSPYTNSCSPCCGPSRPAGPVRSRNMTCY